MHMHKPVYVYLTTSESPGYLPCFNKLAIYAAAVNFAGEDDPSLDKSEAPDLSCQWKSVLQCQGSAKIFFSVLCFHSHFSYLFFIA